MASQAGVSKKQFYKMRNQWNKTLNKSKENSQTNRIIKRFNNQINEKI